MKRRETLVKRVAKNPARERAVHARKTTSEREEMQDTISHKGVEQTTLIRAAVVFDEKAQNTHCQFCVDVILDGRYVWREKIVVF